MSPVRLNKPSSAIYLGGISIICRDFQTKGKATRGEFPPCPIVFSVPGGLDRSVGLL